VGYCSQPSKVPNVKKTRLPDGTIVVNRNAKGEVEYEQLATKGLVHIERVIGYTGEQIRALGMDVVVQQIAETAKQYNCEFVFGDQYGAAFLAPLLKTHKVNLRWFAHSNPSKHEAVLTLRWLMREDRIVICEHEQMKNDLENYPRRVSGSRFVYGFPQTAGHHNDYASAIVTLGHALNGISLGGGVAGEDANGQEYRIQYAPTRALVVKKTRPVPDRFGAVVED
jgi:hypothetical protein